MATASAEASNVTGLLDNIGGGKAAIVERLIAANARARATGESGSPDSNVAAYAAAVTTTDEALLVDLLTQIGVRGSWSRADLVVGALETTSLVVTPTVGGAFRLAGYPSRVSELAFGRGLLAAGDQGVWLTAAGHAAVNGVREVLGWPPLLVLR
ncbi:hypothetical protein ACR5MH_0730 (plasmid) [Streptomyces sp. L7]|uniref:hypothetical protein n=1 Tax=Streptomyces sp. L7 TaxID=3423954 RepID=UPI000E201E4B|nr:hypothetical protein DOE76_15125 [Leifsonia sp. ku-ls]